MRRKSRRAQNRDGVRAWIRVGGVQREAPVAQVGHNLVVAMGKEFPARVTVASHSYWLVVGMLSVWRITHLLYGEDGPWEVIVRLRRAAGDGGWGSLLDCFNCLSLWMAIPFACLLGEGWKERLLLWPALSGGAIVLDRLTAKAQSNPKVFSIENEEGDSVLRQEQNATKNEDSQAPAL